MYDEFILNKRPDATYLFSMPPSVNAAYQNTTNNSRCKSKEYKKWIKLASSELMIQRIKVVEGKIAIRLSFLVPDKKKRDCANYEKVLTDFLVRMKIIDDDSNIRYNTQQWLDWEMPGRGVRVDIFSLVGAENYEYTKPSLCFS